MDIDGAVPQNVELTENGESVSRSQFQGSCRAAGAHLVAVLIMDVHRGQEAVKGRVCVDPAHREQRLLRLLSILYWQCAATPEI